ncbi:uncharacterized protein DNG_08523 [Cephalotrichum gorgonifer]|uniref:WSC domain-containing protein n=1 Tax=Cephalotrichum gorgonifer TaxID=2041049 RepID=A0AAE8SYF6_9PEZI|nr:uncharacterized protein DNG_08523 [Cephalotrichum gorgonifer]
MSLRPTLTGFAGTLLLLTQLCPQLCVAQNVAADFCSTLNTASGDPTLSIYQTQGLCRQQCADKYAFAIVNYQSCWCSNVEPAKSAKVDDDECDTKCPAYSEWCGGKNERFGYLALGKLPESTQSPDPTSSTVSTITGPDGVERTVTITPSSAENDSENPDTGGKKGGLGGGAIGGIVGGILGVVVMALVAGFFIIKRRRSAEGATGSADPRNSNSTAFTEMKDGGGSRNSRLMPADPRMDPYSGNLYIQRKSRESINTLHDEQDYSRRILRATNPDPDVGY